MLWQLNILTHYIYIYIYIYIYSFLFFSIGLYNLYTLKTVLSVDMVYVLLISLRELPTLIFKNWVHFKQI